MLYMGGIFSTGLLSQFQSSPVVSTAYKKILGAAVPGCAAP